MKKTFIKAITGAVLMAAILVGCGVQNSIESTDEISAEEQNEVVSEQNSNESATTEATTGDDTMEKYDDKTGYDSEELMDGEALTEEELKALQDYLSSTDNYKYVLSSYRTPEDVELKEDVTYDGEITCLKGVRNGDLTQVIISFPNTTRYNRRLSLVETNDSQTPYQFCSNRQLWEENVDKIIEAPVYGTNETVTCGVITKYDPCTTEIDIIKDNAVINVVMISPYINEDNVASDEVKELSFYDIDNDGEKDMIAICVYGDETRAILCKAGKDQQGELQYSELKEGFSIWLSENVKDLTADNVINYIKEHQDELKSI